MLLLGQRIPFQEASDCLDKLLRVQVSDRSVHTLVESAGKAVHEEDWKVTGDVLHKEGVVREGTSDNAGERGIAYLQMDGMPVQTREEKWKEIRNGILFLQADNINVDKHHNWMQKKTCCKEKRPISDFSASASPIRKMGGNGEYPFEAGCIITRNFLAPPPGILRKLTGT